MEAEAAAAAQQGGKPSTKASERQAQISRLVSTYRDEAKQLLKDVLKQQHRWRNELQEQGVLTGIPNIRPYVKTLPHVRRRLPWKQAERDALKRQLMGLGLGRWKEIHSVLSSSLRSFKHGPGDVEDACWQLLCELQLLLVAPEDRLFLARLMEPVADRGPISTPGVAFSKLQGSAKSIVRRLALLEEFNALMPALQRSEAVAALFRGFVKTALPSDYAPAPWWDVECDVALLAGMHRHGYANYEAVRQDLDLEPAFQGFHPPPTRNKACPAAPDAPADSTVGQTPAALARQQSDAASEGGPAASAQSAGSAGDGAPAAVSDTAQTKAPATAGNDAPGAAPAAAGCAYEDAWPPAEALNKRARQLCELLAQAVAAADAQGLLLPLPEAVTGSAAADAALKGKFTTAQQPVKPRAGLVFYGISAGAGAAAGTPGVEPWGVDPAAVAAGGALSAADAAVAWSARDRRGPDSPGHGMPGAELALDEGDVDELLGDLAGADLDAELHGAAAAYHEPGNHEEEDEHDDDDDDEDHWCGGDAVMAGAAAAWRRQQARGRGRSRGRGRVGRPSKSTIIAALAVEAAEAAEAAGGEGGRRRQHRPSTRYAEHVLLDLPHAGDGGGGGGRDRDLGGHEVTKKARKELLNLVMTWGLPPAADDAATEAAGAGGAAAVFRASDYDWEHWAGRPGLTAALHRADDEELTAILKELLSEMDEFNSAAAAGTIKPKNLHNPNCECVVCTNRRRFEERKQQEAADAARAAAAAAGASEEQQAAAAAAAAAAVAGGAAGGVGDGGETAEGKASKAPPPKGEVLSTATASRLQERLEQLAAFREALPLLGSAQLEGAFKRGTKDLPGWWGPQQDQGLLAGVLQHGFGNWGPMFEDASLPFKANATAAAAAGDDGDDGAVHAGGKAKGKGAKGGGSVLPEWVPDPKALTKRCKTVAAAIKKALSKPPPGEKKAAGSKAAGKAAQAAAAAASASAAAATAAAVAGKAGAAAAPGGAATLQMQQLAAMGLLQQQGAPVAAGSAAAAAAAARAAGGGSYPGMLPSVSLQQRQQQQQLYMLQQQQQQQQQQQAVLRGKRSASMAGLPAGPEAAAAADAGGGATPTTSSSGAPSPSPVPAAAAAAGPMLVMAGPTIAAAVAAAAVPALSPRQLHALEQLPRLVRDAGGKPVLPLLLSKEQSLLALGRVEPSRAGFHTASHIFPVGFTSSAKFPSSVQPGAEVAYTCLVADGGPAGPLFVVVVSDAPGQQWLGPSPDAVWQQVQQRVQQVQQRPVAADGYELFGLSHPLVCMLIQEMPGADRCESFQPAESAAPPQMVTAIRQAQHIMAQKVQQAQAEAASAFLHQQQQQQQQAPGQALALHQQQQLLRMQQAGQQQPGALPAAQGTQQQQQQQLLQLLQQRQALQQQQALLQQQAALRQQVKQELEQQANKRRRASSGTGGPVSHGTQATPATPGANLAQQLAVLQQQQQPSPSGAQLAALQQLGAVMQQPQFQQMPQQQQQVLLRQLAVGLQHQKQQQQH